MEGTVTWSHSDVPTGVTVENGTVTVAADAEAGAFALTAAAGDTGTTVIIQVKGLTVDWSAVEAVLENEAFTYGDYLHKAALPTEGSATAIVVHTGAFAYVGADDVPAAGTASVTVQLKVDGGDSLYGDTVWEREFAITVARRPVTVTVDDGEKTYGDDNPAFTWHLTDGEMVATESEADLLFATICTADAASPAGVPVSISGESGNDNYAVTVVDGTLTIHRAPLALSDVSDGTATMEKSYDGTALAGALQGTLEARGVNGETVALPIAEAGSYPAANAGTYTVEVTVGDPANANYRWDGERHYSLCNAVITPADYTYTIPVSQIVTQGSGLSAIHAPTAGFGVGKEAVAGVLAWYLDESMTTPATDAAIAKLGSGQSVALFWTFTATNSNYTGGAKIGAVTVVVEKAVLASIQVTKQPSKIQYSNNERLNLTGLEITAIYSDNTTKVITGYTTNPAANSRLSGTGTKTVTVTYREDGATKTTTFTVAVKSTSVGQSIAQAVTEAVKAVSKAVNTILGWISKWF
ncbi:bacterial Ig-like domain-containing protein [Ruminococcaceae bacterium OttesenSCG-928-L11]|nr:bacterial Ig-like domain-containing protein [Ruminococcaceae bacterium OttesenSCG-928-L11]